MKFIVFDTETTGLPKSKYAEPEETWQFPYVVQLSWLIFNTGTNKIETVRDKIIRLPKNIKIPKRATEIHGITQDQMLEEGQPATNVLDTFMRDLSSCTGVIGHNIEFDKKMLEVECIRNKCRRLSSYRKMTFCTMKMGKHTCNIIKENPYTGKLEPKYPKLIELHKTLFKTEPSNLHNSLIDVIVCFRCFHYLTYNVDPVETNDQMKHYCKIYCGL